MDFVVNLPLSIDHYNQECVNILVVTDRLTKKVKYILMNGITAEDTARAFFLYVWKDYGLPTNFITDRGI